MVNPLEDVAAFLAELLHVAGPSGAEHGAAAWLRQRWAPLVDEVGTDALGNTWGIFRGARAPNAEGRRPLLVLGAHVDVIGLVVTRLLPGGFLRIAPIGGIDRRALLGQRVIVEGRQPLPAVVCTVPPHLTTAQERTHLPSFEDLALDTGLRHTALQGCVAVGDRARFATDPVELDGGRLAAPGLDNRAGVAALHGAVRQLERIRLRWDVAVVANVQEEVGLRGISAVAHRLAPDAVVIIDVGFGDQPGVPEHRRAILGKGPVLAIGPSLHGPLAQAILQLADRWDMPIQREAVAGASGTDAWALAAAGVPVALLSIPLRSMHTPVEMVSLSDVAATGRLLAALAQEIDDIDLRRELTP